MGGRENEIGAKCLSTPGMPLILQIVSGQAHRSLRVSKRRTLNFYALCCENLLGREGKKSFCTEGVGFLTGGGSMGLG